jgi:hypothetical protein
MEKIINFLKNNCPEGYFFDGKLYTNKVEYLGSISKNQVGFPHTDTLQVYIFNKPLTMNVTFFIKDVDIANDLGGLTASISLKDFNFERTDYLNYFKELIKEQRIKDITSFLDSY